MVDSFVIFGAPARKSNSRIYTGNAFILGKSAQAYINIFEKQILRLRNKLKVPYDNRRFLWVFKIWYNHVKSDASIELIFDIMQHQKLLTDDVTIRNYIVLSEEMDKEIPRCEIFIYESPDFLDNILVKKVKALIH